METAKDIELDSGGSCGTGMDLLTLPARTQSDTDNLQGHVVGYRPALPGPRLSFTFNNGAPGGWALVDTARWGEAARSREWAVGLQGGISALLTGVPSSLQRTWCRP